MSDPRIAALRREYESVGIDVGDVDPDPFVQFDLWFGDAVGAGLEEANAFVLATANAEGRPSARTLLCKGFDASGMVFFTNYQSRKGRELEGNPWAEAVFLWVPLRRQVRISGQVEKTDAPTSDAYFTSRPPGARLSAVASPQSQVVASRARLQEEMDSLQAEYPEGDVPRPDHWGGYRLLPEEFEFWQGRPDRFHDRLRYRRAGTDWQVERLAP